jgi:hypothetical protein
MDDEEFDPPDLAVSSCCGKQRDLHVVRVLDETQIVWQRGVDRVDRIKSCPWCSRRLQIVHADTASHA